MENIKTVISDKEITLSNIVQVIELPLSPPRLITVFGKDRKGRNQIRRLSITGKGKMALM